MKVRLTDDATLRQEAAADAAPVASLAQGAELELGSAAKAGGAVWVEATLPDGRKGFLPGAAPMRPLREIVVDQAEATLLMKPNAGANVVGKVARNTPLVLLDAIPAPAGEGPGWCLVRHAGLGEGYVAGNTRIRPSDVPELTYGRCFVAGAKIISGMALVGAAFLVINGEHLAAALLLLTCILAGGVAGLVYFATTALRERGLGAQLSWMLVSGAYFAAVGLAFLVIDRVAGGAPALGEQRLTEPMFSSGMLALALLIGLVLGFQEQRVQHQQDGRRWRLADVLLPLLCATAVWMLAGGAIWWWSIERTRPLVEEASEPPQQITLRQLIERGYGANRYLRLTEFRHADHWVVGEIAKVENRRLAKGWAILSPGKTDKHLLHAKAASVPARVHAVVATSEHLEAGKEVQTGPQPLTRDVLLHGVYERSGLRAMVVNGVESLPATVRRGLLELAPHTDLERVVVLSPRLVPLDREAWEADLRRWLLVIGGGAALGALCLAWGLRTWRRNRAGQA